MKDTHSHHALQEGDLQLDTLEEKSA